MREVTKVEHGMPLICKKKRVAAYARVSMDSERLMNSLSNQISYYSEYIQTNPEWIYVGVYADEGITGTLTDKRGEFKRLIEDCEKGKVDIILVKSISRFARNTVDLLKTVRYLKELGVEVRFEKEHINSMSNDGELMLSILASFAQEESRSISENVKWGTQKRFEQGIPNGRFRIFGYRWEEDALVIVPEEGVIVKRIFNEFIGGKTPRAIAKRLNEDGKLTRRGCEWSDFGIRTILKNVTYTGNMLLQKGFVEDPITKRRKRNSGELPRYFVENTHEPIIDKATFDYVQEEIVRRREKRRTVFTAKVKCSKCGAYYIRNTVSHASHYKFWTCPTKRRKGCAVCSAKDIKEEKLKEISAEVLGLTELDEKVFLDKIENIVVEGKDILKFNLVDGTVITRQWKESVRNGSPSCKNNPGNRESVYSFTD